MKSPNQDNGSTGTMILLAATAAAAGAAVGMGVALLFAPCSGAETRDWLARRSREVEADAKSATKRGKRAVRRTATEIGRHVAATARG